MPAYNRQNENPFDHSIIGQISRGWKDKIAKAPADVILSAVKDAEHWKELRHVCTNYDEIIKSAEYKRTSGLERTVAYWTLHYFCTLYGLQEQVTYFRNRFETLGHLNYKLRKDLSTLPSLQNEVKELRKANADMQKEVTSLRRSVAQYKVWNTRYRDKLKVDKAKRSQLECKN